MEMGLAEYGDGIGGDRRWGMVWEVVTQTQRDWN